MIFDRADKIEEFKNEAAIERRLFEDENFAIEHFGLVEKCNEVNEILNKLNDYGHLVDPCEFVD